MVENRILSASSLGAMDTSVIADPRHPDDRNRGNIDDNVRNRTTAFSLSSGRDLVMRYTYKRANMQVIWGYTDPGNEIVRL